MGKGQELYRKAKTLIPGGTMLLSKRPEMFLPENWPSYYSKAKGCYVWDLDGNQLLDMSIMGIGTNVLGYGNEQVDLAVLEVVKNGNMSTLNCPEEVELAEQLVAINPFADMVRFARSGGEANAIAIRIARAASGRDQVAFCGYHGWHDWYLSANLKGNERLGEHLLPGLDPAGVPKNLSQTVFPFRYNDLQGLQSILEENPGIGVIKMEVSRNDGPAPGFLEAVRELASARGIVLIFDECTSGFRETFGGLYQKYGVEPDIAMFGKTMGNGYAITAVVGRREVMESAQKTFISSTFWTERIGPTAALASMKEMQALKSWEVITATGKKITKRWKDLADTHKLSLSTAGLAALTSFSLQSEDWLKYKTFITQEMLKQGILASNAVYVSVAHREEEINQYFEALDTVFAQIAKFENDDRSVDEALEGPVCHQGFQRLN